MKRRTRAQSKPPGKVAAPRKLRLNARGSQPRFAVSLSALVGADLEDLRDARAALAEPGPGIALRDLKKDLGF